MNPIKGCISLRRHGAVPIELAILLEYDYAGIEI
jgi:hypothetical protein